MEEEVTHAETRSSLLSWTCSHRHVSWVRLNLLKLTRDHILQLSSFHQKEEWLYVTAPYVSIEFVLSANIQISLKITPT